MKNCSETLPLNILVYSVQFKHRNLNSIICGHNFVHEASQVRLLLTINRPSHGDLLVGFIHHVIFNDLFIVRKENFVEKLKLCVEMRVNFIFVGVRPMSKFDVTNQLDLCHRLWNWQLLRFWLGVSCGLKVRLL